ncbi:MAG: lysyl endopeptidase, partial [Halieaceae bacterium]
ALMSWRRLPDGAHAGTLEVASEQAMALRLGLLVVGLPKGTRLSFYSPDDRAGTSGNTARDAALARVDTVPGDDILAALAANAAQGERGPDARTYWSPLVEGERLAMEVYLAPGVEPAQLRVRARRLSHLVYSPDSGSSDLLMPRVGEAQSCSLDAVCSAAWEPTRDSVARITYVDGGTSYLCSGTLLNDSVGSGAPYFLTANHCVNSQTAASTLTSYWFYESTACNSGSLRGDHVRLGGGAALLYNSTDTDASFMRLNELPPTGAVYAGWSTQAPSQDQLVSMIHHPRGDLKKISEGYITGFQRCILAGEGFVCSSRRENHPEANFMDVRLTLGTTETGSSGSAIFSDDGQQILGTLWGGTSSCSNPGGANAFGRFERSYVQGDLEQWLSPSLIYSLSVSAVGEGTGIVVSNPAGISCGASCAQSFIAGTVISLSAEASEGAEFAGWDGACTGTGSCMVTLSGDLQVSAHFAAVPEPMGSLSLQPARLDFAPQSLGTLSLPLSLELLSDGDRAVLLEGVVVDTPFALDNSGCTALPLVLNPGQSCALTLRYSPQSAGAVEGVLSLQSDAGDYSVLLAGAGEASLFTHYYSAILGRLPDAPGRAFWEGEYSRVQALGADSNEVWYTMAQNFFNSVEYLAFARSDEAFLEDLYRTFFSRAADTDGLAFWLGQLQQGMPRDVVLVSFMFSAEFVGFTQALFGSTAVAPELNAVMDLYRGMLARLPDEDGFAYWLEVYRAAQCAAQESELLVAEVAANMTGQFIDSDEYRTRNRSNAGYVADLYNAVLRRGGELIGVRFWINALDSGSWSRDEVRLAFLDSEEFQLRVQGLIASTGAVCAGP